MQVADGFEVFSMLDADLLRATIERRQPDYIVPEIEAIRTEVLAEAEHISLPCVLKPVMSSSGKGESTVRTADELEPAWNYAGANMRGDRSRVIVEEFVDFGYEITLLTVRSMNGVNFCPPIGHRQERGDYQESWQPAPMTDHALAAPEGQVGLRIFAKPTTRPYRRIRVTLTLADGTDSARRMAAEAAAKLRIIYEG